MDLRRYGPRWTYRCGHRGFRPAKTARLGRVEAPSNPYACVLRTGNVRSRERYLVKPRYRVVDCQCNKCGKRSQVTESIYGCSRLTRNKDGLRVTLCYECHFKGQRETFHKYWKDYFRARWDEATNQSGVYPPELQ